MPASALFVLVAYLGIVLMSITLHEYAHGWMAVRSGDLTPEDAGRLTLNPLAHIDLIWTIICPILMLMFLGFALGAAKPVPVNPYNFRNLKRDYRLVSVAGVAVNFLLAVILSLLLRFFQATSGGRLTYGSIVLGMGVITNFALFVFNLIPVPPLDGSKILRSYLPDSIGDAYERMGFLGLIIIIGFVYLFGGVFFYALDFLWRLVGLDRFLMYQIFDSFSQEIRNIRGMF